MSPSQLPCPPRPVARPPPLVCGAPGRTYLPGESIRSSDRIFQTSGSGVAGAEWVGGIPDSPPTALSGEAAAKPGLEQAGSEPHVVVRDARHRLQFGVKHSRTCCGLERGKER